VKSVIYTEIFHKKCKKQDDERRQSDGKNIPNIWVLQVDPQGTIGKSQGF
jgi:hypothetical protein